MYIKSSELKQGQVVNCHGMLCEIDQEIKQYPSGHGIVYHTSAKVINLDECKEGGTLYWKEEDGTVHDGLIPLSWLYPDVFRGGWTKDMEATPRWTIQGNDRAGWWVEE